MLDPRIELLFRKLPANYPRHLARDHVHILNHIVELWDSPEFDSYINDLLIDKRGGRSGFSLKVVAELMFIRDLHNIFKHEGLRFPELAVSWEPIQVADPTPNGFQHVIEHGHIDAIASFLDAGVSANYRFEGAQTPLIIATASGQVEVARYLIEHGAGVNLRDEGKYTALHWAAYYNHEQIADDLIAAGAAINVAQNSGETPLTLAVTRDHLDVAKLLLERQADPNISGNNGKPLAIALRINNPAMIALLKQFNANT